MNKFLDKVLQECYSTIILNILKAMTHTFFTLDWVSITWTINPKLKIGHIIICCHRLAICLLPIYAQFARLQISANLYALVGPYQLIEQHFVVATFQNTKRCKERSIFIFDISSPSTRKCWGLLINTQNWCLIYSIPPEWRTVSKTIRTDGTLKIFPVKDSAQKVLDSILHMKNRPSSISDYHKH